MDADLADRFIDVDVKLAYQERLIRDLDALVREFAERLAKSEKKLAELEASVRSGTLPVGPANEPPPHY